MKKQDPAEKDDAREAARQLRVLLVSLLLVAGSTVLFSFTSARLLSDDRWAHLGLNQQETDSRIKESFLYGYLQHSGLRGLKNLAVGERAAFIKDIASYAKLYLQSEAFKKEYQQYRERTKPLAPEKARTKEQIQKEQIEQYKELIRDMEENLKQAAPEFKKIYQDRLVQLRGELKKWEDLNFKVLQKIAEGEQQTYKFRLTDYKENLAEWEQTYPANPQHLVRLRLQEFLEKTQDVDYSAQLTEGRYGKMVFTNPDYERKPGDWKKAFRAGKEATETAPAFANAWLAEIK